MARSDVKYDRRLGPYTEEEKRRREQEQREERKRQKREQERQKAQREQRKQMLNAMTPDARGAFLAKEAADLQADQKAMRARSEQREQQWKAEQVDHVVELQSTAVRLTGFLHSELATALANREMHDLFEGDFLDDPVEAMQGRAGFGEDTQQAQGIRLLVNLCVDGSNSMGLNDTEGPALEATRTLYAMLDNVRGALPDGQLEVEVWGWAMGREGKQTRHITRPLSDWERGYETHLTPQQHYVNAINNMSLDGEDTWISPLFETLLKHEVQTGWMGGARLDIIITDGVLEHRTDRQKASDLQLLRDGGVTTILLNLLPMDDWADVHLPDHCLQYEATVDNLFSLMTKVLGEWVNAV